jgi:hypothetical protein
MINWSIMPGQLMRTALASTYEIAFIIQESRIVEMRCSPSEVRVVDAGPLPTHNREVLEELLKKVALRKLKQMQ